MGAERGWPSIISAGKHWAHWLKLPALTQRARARPPSGPEPSEFMDSIELIRQFLQERLGVQADRVHPDAALAELGVDSLMVAELMFEAEDRLGITIDSQQGTPVTVGDMQRFIDRLLAEKPGQA